MKERRHLRLMQHATSPSIRFTAIVPSEHLLERLLNHLEYTGYGQDDIQVLMTEETRERYLKLKGRAKMPEGALIGGLSGSVLGAIIGGVAMAGLTIVTGPGVAIAGPIVGAVAGTALGSYTGTALGALIGAGIPEHEAGIFAEALKQDGSILIIVHVREEDAEDLEDELKDLGLRHIRKEESTPNRKNVRRLW